jgi:anti-sigma factor RsiW
VNRILRFESSAHREVERLLPWYVNGTLDDELRERVQLHLADCVRCRRELEQCHELKLACSDTVIAHDVGAAFERLRQRIETSEKETTRRRRFDFARFEWREAPTWLRWTAAVQLLAIVALSLSVIGYEPLAPAYRTLGNADAQATVESGAPSHHLVVVFDSELSQARMRVLLRASQARVIDGPSEAGAYVLALPADRVAAVQEALRAAPGVVMVERVDPAEGAR